jgi:hypothetical protein
MDLSLFWDVLYIIHKFYLSALLLHINYDKSHNPSCAQFALKGYKGFPSGINIQGGTKVSNIGCNFLI